MPRPKLQNADQNVNLIPTSIFVIGCGGETEAIYFDKLIEGRGNVQVRTLPPGKDGLSTPLQTLARIDDFWSGNDIEPGDQVWLVLDVDHFFDPAHRESTIEVLVAADQKGYLIAISNPCFELWLLLHTEEVLASWPDCHSLIAHLRKKWGSYGKKKIDMDFLRPRIRDGMARAKRIDVVSANAVPGNPGSRIYTLMQAIDLVMSGGKIVLVLRRQARCMKLVSEGG